MDRNRLLGVVSVLVLGLSLSSAARGAPPPVEAFARANPYSSPRLSPEGTYLAVPTNFGEGQHALQVFRVADMERTALLRLPRYESPVQVAWVSDQRLVIGKGRHLGSLERPLPMGEVIASDFDGSNQKYIYGYEQANVAPGLDRGFGVIEAVAEAGDGRFYLRQRKLNEKASTLYEVDSRGPTFRRIAHIDQADLRFVLDRQGVARFAWGHDVDDNYLLFASDDGMRWRPARLGNGDGESTPFAFSADGSQVYAMRSIDGAPLALVRSAADGSHAQVLAEDSFSSIGQVQWTRTPSVPFAATPSDGVPRFRYFDPEHPEALLHQMTSHQFPGKVATLLAVSRDGNVALLFIGSDRDPGAWFVFERASNSLRRLLGARDELDPELMAERRPVRFTAGDGVELEAILTLPAGANAAHAALPTVVLPHGGPHGVRDEWSFDHDAQFLASRGYLVVQVNYRGSTGRGGSFERLGYLQWGTRIQQDILDGVQWAIDQGLADPARVCAVGASFGAYSAMMLAAAAPDLVKCAAGLAGVYDLEMMYSKGDIRGRATGRAYLQRVIGRSDEVLQAQSPTGVAARIRAPVLLVHGERDTRTPLAQAQAMRKALTEAGRPPRWMSVRGEGHGFHDDDNAIAYYRALEDFLHEHIGP